MKLRVLVSAVAMAAVLSGCGSMMDGQRAPIYDRTGGLGQGPVELTGQTYMVQPGDTLYSIATRHGIKPTELARANGITDPTQMRIGTVLNLTVARTAPVTEVTPEDAALAPEASQTVIIEGEAQPVTDPTTGEVIEPQKALGNTMLIWPCERGDILTPFAKDGSKGVVIAGVMGADVKAAGTGRVLYTGENVSGYGKLIIISHGPGAVTVYGHNSELLVKRGDQVEAGQVIAKIGNTDSKFESLLFEVRHNDKPVDPMKYLPR